MAIVSIISIFVVRVEFKTILFDFLPSSVVKIILVINLVMTILISILLIIGSLKRNHYMMLPWVILGIMLAIGLLISVIYTAVMLLIDGFVVHGVLWIVLGLLAVGKLFTIIVYHCIQLHFYKNMFPFLVIYTYMWTVVFSYFTILKNENDRGKYSRQPYRR